MEESIFLVVLKPEKKNPDPRTFEHLGIMQIAAVLREKGFSVQILDQNLTNTATEEIIAELIRLHPPLIGISCYQEAFLPLQRFTQMMKNRLPHTHLSLGGVFATNSFAQILSELPALDSIVLGDGEKTFVALADAVYNGKDWTELPHLTYTADPQMAEKDIYFEPDLDRLPNVARDTLPLVLSKGLYPLLSTSRGCYGGCSYCSIVVQNRRRRCRSMDRVIDEMERLQKDFHTDYIYLIDDTFIGRTEEDYLRVSEFARKLMRRKLPIQFSFECRANEVDPYLLPLLQEARLRSVFVGIESGYQPTLDLFNKGLKVADNERAIKTLQTLGIPFTIGFLPFHPYTTLAEITANLSFLYKTDQRTLLNSLGNRLLVFHNSPLWRRAGKDGLLSGIWHDTSYTFANPEITPLDVFIDYFIHTIRPDVERLARHFSQLSEPVLQKKATDLYTHLCTTLIRGIQEYTDQPLPEILDEYRQRLVTLSTESRELLADIS